MPAERKSAKSKRSPSKRMADWEYRFHDPSAIDGTDTALIRLKKDGWEVQSSSTKPDKVRVVLLKRARK